VPNFEAHSFEFAAHLVIPKPQHFDTLAR